MGERNDLPLAPAAPASDAVDAPPPAVDASPPAVEAPAVVAPSPAAKAATSGSAAAAPASRPSAMLDALTTELGVEFDAEGKPGTYEEKTITAPGGGRRAGPPQARVQVSGERSPNLGLLAEGLAGQERAQAQLTRAFQAQEQARAEALRETSDLLGTEANRLAEQREQAMQESIESSRRLQAQADSLGAMAPSPGRLFGTDSQAASFGAALSIAAGAMLSARTGGPNVALKIIDTAIKRDMESQREAIKNQQFAAQMGLQLAQEMRAAYRDDVAASNAMQATLLRYSENRIAAITAETNNPVLQARGQEAIANLRMQYAQLIEQVTRQKFGVTMAMPLRKAQGMLAASQGQTLPPISDPDMAQDAARDGGEATQRGLEAAAVGAAEEGQAAETKAQVVPRTKRTPRRAAAPAPAPADQHPLVGQHGITAHPKAPGYAITADGRPIPPGATIAKWGGRGTRAVQALRVSEEYYQEPPPGWEQDPRSEPGARQIVRVGALRRTPLDEKRAALLRQRRDRTITSPLSYEIPGDLQGRTTVGSRQQTTRVPYYEGMDSDLKALRDSAQGLNQWGQIYREFKNLRDEDAWKQWRSAEGNARKLQAIALYNEQISKGGVLNAGEVETIGSFLEDPDTWNMFAKKGGWQQMDKMMREAHKIRLDAVMNAGMGPPPIDPSRNIWGSALSTLARKGERQ